jgi:hypothetical protein
MYKNGIYETIFGKARENPLRILVLKGILFKISGKQSLNFNGSHLSKAPNPEYLPECTIE